MHRFKSFYWRNVIYILIAGCTIVIVFPSCATLLNSQQMTMHIHSNKECTVYVNDNKVEEDSNPKKIEVPRSKNPLFLDIETDNLQKNITIYPHTSPLFYLNIFSYAFLGFLIDYNANKRYDYPRDVYLQFDKKQFRYSTSVPFNTKLPLHRNIIKLTPFRMVGLIHPSFDLTYERILTKHHSFQATAGILYNNFNTLTDYNEIDKEVTGWKANMEYRYYLLGSNPSGYYVSADASFFTKNHNAILTFLRPHPTFPMSGFRYSDSIRIHQQTIGLHVLGGWQKIYSRIIIDIFAGFGLRLRKIQHSNRIFTGDKIAPNDYLTPFSLNYSEGSRIQPSIPLNIKIGWLF
jgi:hypothetical protein